MTTTPHATVRRPIPASQWLNGASAALMLAVLVPACAMECLSNGGTSRATITLLHQSAGPVILVLTAMRLVWWAIHPPPHSTRWAAWDSAAAMASHALLYVALLAMPLSGYLMATERAVPYFSLFEALRLTPATDAVSPIGSTMHAVGQWAIYGLVALQITAAVWPATTRQDDTPDRTAD
jgi:cytochrome b561